MSGYWHVSPRVFRIGDYWSLDGSKLKLAHTRKSQTTKYSNNEPKKRQKYQCFSQVDEQKFGLDSNKKLLETASMVSNVLHAKCCKCLFYCLQSKFICLYYNTVSSLACNIHVALHQTLSSNDIYMKLVWSCSISLCMIAGCIVWALSPFSLPFHLVFNE